MRGDTNPSLIVLDTNVLVSGLLSPLGPPGQIVDLAVAGVVRLALDDRVVDEYRRVCARPRFDLDRRLVAAVIDALKLAAANVTAAPLGLDIPDRNDLPFLEVAAAAECPLVTGNSRHYTPSSGRLPIKLLSPREFIEKRRDPPKP